MKILIQINKKTSIDYYSRKAFTAFLVFLFFFGFLSHPGFSITNTIGSDGLPGPGSDIPIYKDESDEQLLENLSVLSLHVISPDNFNKNNSLMKTDPTDLILLSMAAEKMGVHFRSNFTRELEWYRINLLAWHYVREISRNWDMSQKRLEEFYHLNLDRYITKEAVKIRHILLHESDLAYTVLLKLIAGDSFESLSEEYSKDLSTAMDGGYLGWFSRGQLPQYMETEVFQLEPGSSTWPVETSYGFHIIQCIEKRPALQLTYPEVSIQVYQDLIGYYLEEEVKALENLFVLPEKGQIKPPFPRQPLK